MSKKINPVRMCSCFFCRRGNDRAYYYKVANRKFRHKNKQSLKTINLSDDWNEILIAGGYTD